MQERLELVVVLRQPLMEAGKRRKDLATTEELFFGLIQNGGQHMRAGTELAFGLLVDLLPNVIVHRPQRSHCQEH